ncbi:MAG TPA: ATP-binding protein [Candidatus Saccharibacteria bacterium]|nr:ATP-binding protein [Candidatus Saccharibacteria bacterium]HRK94259.1 ATP-binding protein [Candidatus Saccharibacteria bacterium]
MKKGGIGREKPAHVLFVAAIIIPVILLINTWLLAGSTDTMYPGLHASTMLAVLLGWMLFSVWSIRRSEVSPELQRILIYFHHLFLAAYILLAGVTTVGLLAWMLLGIVAYARSQLRGYSLSVGMMLFLTAFDPFIKPYTLEAVIVTFSSFVMAVLTGFVIISLKPVRTVNNFAALSKSREREQAEHERILTLINNLADAIFGIDKSGNVTIFNAATLNLLDTNTSLEGQSLNDVLPVHDEEGKPVDMFERIKSSRSVTVDDTLRLETSDGVIRLELTYAPIRGSYMAENASAGDDQGFIIIARDVTRVKSLEEERDEFISVVSHELRTPVTVAEGTVSNVQLMMERGKGTKKDMAESLSEAHDQVVYLSKMINDLSTLSRAERGVAAESELIDVADLAHDLYNEYSPEADKQSIHLNLELGSKLGSVSTSRLYLHELLQNFVTNGIKYTRKGHVTLKIHRDSEAIRFEVSDTGIGISRSDQAKIFNKFYRSEDYRTRETGGTGLGLYVAAKLAHKIGTKIEVKSRLNHGSTFSFTLPVAK